MLDSAVSRSHGNGPNFTQNDLSAEPDDGR